MKTIQIDREKRLLLLQWLKQGHIVQSELNRLQDECPMTLEEINEEIRRLSAIDVLRAEMGGCQPDAAAKP